MLTLRLLGEIEVWRDDERLALPPSRKTRALLAYLAATGRAHRRERLCSLFWEVPDDPRGALRWSLSRLRAIVDDDDARRIVADRETVGFEALGAGIDLAALRRHGKDLAALPTEKLVELAGLFRGEFLEGIDLPDLHDFQAWCLAEREDVRGLQSRILTILSERLVGEPAAALPHARQLVQIDPYNAAARASLLRHLVALGRRSEAEQHFEAGSRALREVGDGAEIPLLKTWRELRDRQRPIERADESADAAPPAVVAPEPAAAPLAARAAAHHEEPPLVGRAAELDRLVGLLAAAAAGGGVRTALVSGEPGLGKSRLVEELVALADAQGVATFVGRAYEIDRGRPYGVWSEALGPVDETGAMPAADGLLPLAGGDMAAANAVRERIFAAVSERLFAGNRPVLLVFDDMQWCDEPSADLMHRLVRTDRRRQLMVLLVGRSGELSDNAPLLAALRSLRHNRLLDDVALAPLPDDDVVRLVNAVAPAADAAHLAGQAGGNPLFAVELARSVAEGGDGLSRSLKEIVRDRIDRLPADAVELLRWASVLGPCFPVARLAPLLDLDADRVVAALDLLVAHSLLDGAASGEDACDFRFAHDLVRHAVYTGLSEPRRRLMHHRIAGLLVAAGVGNETLAAEVAHHAVLGGDAGMAAAAFGTAARRCLRLFANSEAAALARRGQRFAEDLPEPERLKRTIELMQVELAAQRPRDLGGLIAKLESLAERALDHACAEHARIAFQMLSDLRWEHGFWSGAERDTLRAEVVSRATEPDKRILAMAETARCLAMLERDLGQADALLLEANALARRLGVEPNALADADGLLRSHQGRFEDAAALFRRARIVAQRDGERTSEFLALEHLIDIELMRKRYVAAEALAAEMVRLADKIRAGSEGPFARAIEALCRVARNDPKAEVDFAKALTELRAADAKHRLSLTLRVAAGIDLADGRLDRAAERAGEALAFALAIDRPSDIALARTLLAAIAAAHGDGPARDLAIAALEAEVARPVSDHARRQAEAVLAMAGAVAPPIARAAA